jgi:hypothetical protein
VQGKPALSDLVGAERAAALQNEDHLARELLAAA